MRCRRRVCAAIFVAAAVNFCGNCVTVGPCQADEQDDAKVILFSGRDIWRNGIFAYGGMIFGPGGFEQDGPLFKAQLSGGLYRYRAGSLAGEQVIGAEWLIQALPGWRIKRGPFEAKIFFGPEYQIHHLWPDDPDNRLRGRALGLRFAIELWAEPTMKTMAAVDASLLSVGSIYAARAALGWRVLDAFYVGPETQAYGGNGYSQIRFGGHITSMKTGATEWSAGGGWAIASDGRSSPYLRLNVMTRR
jgi:Cellulose biosynthesis protein BcsS